MCEAQIIYIRKEKEIDNSLYIESLGDRLLN